MRVRSIEISGFRAFSGQVNLNLDGDVVLVVGANGQGKTSLFDAILWAITGGMTRLEHQESVVSLYSESGEAQVQVTIASDDDREILISRRHDGRSDRLYVEDGDKTFSGNEAEYELIRRLWPEGSGTNEPREALRLAFERGIYLQQDVLTGFLTADTENDRFNAITQIMGAGLVTELQASLESSRLAWSRATNQLRAQTVDTEERRSRLGAQLREMIEMAPTDQVQQSEWISWWTEAMSLGVPELDVPRVESSDAHAAIDTAMSQLRAIRLSRERRGEDLRGLLEMVRELSGPQDNLDELQQAVEESNRALSVARETLAEAELRASEIRRGQVQVRSEQEELRVLAEVALRHLHDYCPVCQQTYDRDATRERLNGLINIASPTPGFSDAMPDLAALATEVQLKENQASAAELALQDARRQVQIRADRQERINVGMAENEVTVTDGTLTSSALEAAIEENNQHIARIATVGGHGETIALSLARTGQLARQRELGQEVQQLNSELLVANVEIQTREETREAISQMIESLRDASSDMVVSELSRLEYLLQRIYAAADPHPEFRTVRLITRMRQGRGRLFAELVDQQHGFHRQDPQDFLSSSQLNVLAVSVFLALNLSMPSLPVQLAILDDPLQSLDDLNLLGMVDILKRLREQRQLMISTHDSRFASLLERKLRPISISQRTVRVELSGWNSTGPLVTQTDVERDSTPIRIAAA